jgi:O-antigen/teichoic acid export membrane protein
MILVKTIARWSSPDLLDIPFKIIIYFTLINSLEKFDFGLLSIAMMIFSYSSVSQFGIVDWLLYELPKKYSLNLKMNDLIAQSYTFVFVNQLIMLVIVFLIVLYFDEGSWFFRIACATYMLHTIFYNRYLHKRLYLRFQHRFKHLFNVQFILVISKFIMQFVTLKFFGIYGFLIIEMTIYLLPICLFKSDSDFSLFDRDWISNYSYLFKNGLPFFAVILLSTILANLDKWFIIGNFGVEKFATYSLGVFLVTGLMVFPGKVLSIFTQYMKEMYILDKNLSSNIVRNLSVNNILIFLLLCLITLLQLVSVYITLLLPKYADVLPLINSFLLSALLSYGVSLTSNILYLIEKREYVAKIQFFIVIIYVLLLIVNSYFNLNIIYIIWSMCTVLILQICINLGSLVKFVKLDDKSELYKFFITIIGSVLYYGVNEYRLDAIPFFYYLSFAVFILFIKFDNSWKNFKHIATRDFSA